MYANMASFCSDSHICWSLIEVFTDTRSGGNYVMYIIMASSMRCITLFKQHIYALTDQNHLSEIRSHYWNKTTC